MTAQDGATVSAYDAHWPNSNSNVKAYTGSEPIALCILHHQYSPRKLPFPICVGPGPRNIFCS